MKVLSEYYFMKKDIESEKKKILKQYSLGFVSSYNVIDKTGKIIYNASPEDYPYLYRKLGCIECKRNELKNIKADIESKTVDIGVFKEMVEYDY